VKDYKSRDTRFGFVFNGTSIERIACDEKHTVIGIFAKRQMVEIIITPGGYIRVQNIEKVPRASR
jgi:hypothetical protein